MIKLPWDKSKKSVEVEDDKIDVNDMKPLESDLENFSEASDDKNNESLLNSNEKTFEYSDLPKECKKLVDEIKIADLQIQLTKDTISLIKPSRDRIFNDLKEKLLEIDPVKD